MAEPAGGEITLAGAGAALVEAIDDATPQWISQAVVARLNGPLTDELRLAIEQATADARNTVVPRLRELLALDLEDQWTNPLALVRAMVRYPTEILTSVGAPPVKRDDHACQLQPDDIYDLTPTSFADFGSQAHEPGLIWGAAKAYLHLQRRKSEDTA